MFLRMVYKSGQIFLPFCHNARVWQTDRQTDGRTDRQTDQTDRILIARPHVHSMQCGKNSTYFYSAMVGYGMFQAFSLGIERNKKQQI